MCKCSNHDSGRSLLWNNSPRTDRLSGGKGGGDAGAAGGQVIGDGVFDESQQPLGPVCSPNAELVKKLDWGREREFKRANERRGGECGVRTENVRISHENGVG